MRIFTSEVYFIIATNLFIIFQTDLKIQEPPYELQKSNVEHFI